MKNTFAALCLVLSLAARSPAQLLTGVERQFIDSVMTANYAPDEPGAVLLVARDGKPVFRGAYGLANVELGVPNTPEYLFRIGSMTKQFTAVCMLRLAQEGRLSLSDDIRRYLPWYDTHGRTVTIEHCLTHTSGIPSYTEKPDFSKKTRIDFSKEEIVEYFMHDSLLFEPGTDFSYSNSGYFLVGLIVEKVSGLSLDEFMRKSIFEPLGMGKTRRGTDAVVIPGAVTGYESAGDSLYMDAPYLSWTWPYAAGDLLSSVDDLLKWDEALYGEELVKHEWTQKAWRSFVLLDGRQTNYGYGWAVNEYRGLRLISHGGGINGFLSTGIRVPSQHLYVVILSNKAVKAPGQFSRLIAMRLAGMPMSEPQTHLLPSGAAREYEGVYEIQRERGRRTTNTRREKTYRYVTVRNDSLFSQPTGGVKTALLNVGEDLFILEGRGTFTRFRRNSAGKITSLELYDEPVNLGPISVEPRTELSIPAERAGVTIDAGILAQYRGRYDFGGGFSITVTTEGSRIFTQATGQAVVEIYAESERKFFLKVVDASVEFLKDREGKVTGMVLTQGGRYEAKKIE